MVMELVVAEGFLGLRILACSCSVPPSRGLAAGPARAASRPRRELHHLYFLARVLPAGPHEP
jgi:hypothetical protein